MLQVRPQAVGIRGQRSLAYLVAFTFAVCLLLSLRSTNALSFSVVLPWASVPRGASIAGSSRVAAAAAESVPVQNGDSAISGVFGLGSLLAGMAMTACAMRGVSMLAQAHGRSSTPSKQASDEDLEMSRRMVFMPVAIASATASVCAPADPAFAQGATSPAAPTVDLPDRIKENPYDLIGMVNMDDNKEDRKEFYMKKQYRQDTYQVLKHMKISGSLDKGTPNMERWNKRVKEEMDDWVALYRRQGSVVGRQSYYSLYSAVNTLASHFTSYGPKFPFPNKKRPRFYELVNTTEKYLEKGK